MLPHAASCQTRRLEVTQPEVPSFPGPTISSATEFTGLAVFKSRQLFTFIAHGKNIVATCKMGATQPTMTFGSEARLLSQPSQLCRSACGKNVLVAERGGCCVKELTLSGEVVRVMPTDRPAVCVAAHRDVIAVAQAAAADAQVLLISQRAGTRMRSLSVANCRGLAFTDEGGLIVAQPTQACLHNLPSAEAPTRYIADAHADISSVCSKGDLVMVTDRKSNAVLVFDKVSATLLGTIALAASGVASPIACVAVGDPLSLLHLYVLDGTLATLHCWTLRLTVD